MEIITIEGKRYKKIDTSMFFTRRYTDKKTGHITVKTYIKPIRVIDFDKWTLINGEEYEELD